MAYLAELRNAKLQKDKKYLLANQTVRDVAAAYGLTPPVTDFSQDMSLNFPNRRVLPWRPHYSEQEDYDADERRWKRFPPERLAEEARNNSVVVDGQRMSLGVAAGTTFPNGRISLYSALFEFQSPLFPQSRSDLRIPVPPPGAPGNTKTTLAVARDPDLIALAVYHETIHWIQKVSKADYHNEGPVRDFGDEREAYDLAADFARAMQQSYAVAGDSANASKLEAEGKRLAGAAKQFKKQEDETRLLPLGQQTYPKLRELHRDWIFPRGAGLNSVLPPEEAPLDGLEDVKAASDLGFLRSWSSIAEPLSRQREERQAAAAIDREQFLRRSRWNALVSWTSVGCRFLHPRSYGDNAEINAAYREMDEIQRKFLLNHYVVLPREEIVSGLAEHGARLDACQKELVNLFVQAEGPLDVSWFVERMEYERAGGDFGAGLRKIAKSIGDGLAVIVKGISQPLIAVGKAVGGDEPPRRGEDPGNGRRGPRDEQPGTPQHPPSVAPSSLRGPAWGQATSVKLRGW